METVKAVGSFKLEKERDLNHSSNKKEIKIYKMLLLKLGRI